MLRVSERTLHNWTTGCHAVPYSAFKLVRVMRGMDIPFPGWEGWTFSAGHLYSPEGHRFSGKDSSWWSLLVRQARAFGAVYQENNRLRQRILALEAGAISSTLSPAALPPAGVRVYVTPHFSLTGETNCSKNDQNTLSNLSAESGILGGASLVGGRQAASPAKPAAKGQRKPSKGGQRVQRASPALPRASVYPECTARDRLARFLPGGAQ